MKLDCPDLTIEERTAFLDATPEIRQLVIELIELPPSANHEDPARVRSAQITAELNRRLSIYDAAGIFQCLRGAWHEATILADQLNLCKGHFNPAASLGLQIAGLLNVRANMGHARYCVEQMTKSPA